MNLIDEIESQVTHIDEVNAVAEAYKNILDGKYVVYLSTPITTGLESLKNPYKESVIEYNKNQAYKFEKYIQSHDKYGKQSFVQIINPAEFNIDHWTRYDYLYMWKTIIVEFVSEIIFNKNWQYSNGCCFEYLVGKTQNNIVLRELTLDNYISDNIDNYYIRSVIDTIRSSEYGDATFINRVLGELLNENQD